MSLKKISHVVNRFKVSVLRCGPAPHHHLLVKLFNNAFLDLSYRPGASKLHLSVRTEPVRNDPIFFPGYCLPVYGNTGPSSARATSSMDYRRTALSENFPLSPENRYHIPVLRSDHANTALNKYNNLKKSFSSHFNKNLYKYLLKERKNRSMMKTYEINARKRFDSYVNSRTASWKPNVQQKPSLSMMYHPPIYSNKWRFKFQRDKIVKTLNNQKERNIKQRKHNQRKVKNKVFNKSLKRKFSEKSYGKGGFFWPPLYRYKGPTVATSSFETVVNKALQTAREQKKLIENEITEEEDTPKNIPIENLLLTSPNQVRWPNISDKIRPTFKFYTTEKHRDPAQRISKTFNYKNFKFSSKLSNTIESAAEENQTKDEINKTNEKKNRKIDYDKLVRINLENVRNIDKKLSKLNDSIASDRDFTKEMDKKIKKLKQSFTNDKEESINYDKSSNNQNQSIPEDKKVSIEIFKRINKLNQSISNDKKVSMEADKKLNQSKTNDKEVSIKFDKSLNNLNQSITDNKEVPMNTDKSFTKTNKSISNDNKVSNEIDKRLQKLQQSTTNTDNEVSIGSDKILNKFNQPLSNNREVPIGKSLTKTNKSISNDNKVSNEIDKRLQKLQQSTTNDNDNEVSMKYDITKKTKFSPPLIVDKNVSMEVEKKLIPLNQSKTNDKEVLVKFDNRLDKLNQLINNNKEVSSNIDKSFSKLIQAIAKDKKVSVEIYKKLLSIKQSISKLKEESMKQQGFTKSNQSFIDKEVSMNIDNSFNKPIQPIIIGNHPMKEETMGNQGLIKLNLSLHNNKNVSKEIDKRLVKLQSTDDKEISMKNPSLKKFNQSIRNDTEVSMNIDNSFNKPIQPIIIGNHPIKEETMENQGLIKLNPSLLNNKNVSMEIDKRLVKLQSTDDKEISMKNPSLKKFNQSIRNDAEVSIKNQSLNQSMKNEKEVSMTSDKSLNKFNQPIRNREVSMKYDKSLNQSLRNDKAVSTENLSIYQLNQSKRSDKELSKEIDKKINNLNQSIINNKDLLMKIENSINRLNQSISSNKEVSTENPSINQFNQSLRNDKEVLMNIEKCLNRLNRSIISDKEESLKNLSLNRLNPSKRNDIDISMENQSSNQSMRNDKEVSITSDKSLNKFNQPIGNNREVSMNIGKNFNKLNDKEVSMENQRLNRLNQSKRNDIYVSIEKQSLNQSMRNDKEVSITKDKSLNKFNQPVGNDREISMNIGKNFNKLNDEVSMENQSLNQSMRNDEEVSITSDKSLNVYQLIGNNRELPMNIGKSFNKLNDKEVSMENQSLNQSISNDKDALMENIILNKLNQSIRNDKLSMSFDNSLNKVNQSITNDKEVSLENQSLNKLNQSIRNDEEVSMENQSLNQSISNVKEISIKDNDQLINNNNYPNQLLMANNDSSIFAPVETSLNKEYATKIDDKIAKIVKRLFGKQINTAGINSSNTLKNKILKKYGVQFLNNEKNKVANAVVKNFKAKKNKQPSSTSSEENDNRSISTNQLDNSDNISSNQRNDSNPNNARGFCTLRSSFAAIFNYTQKRDFHNFSSFKIISSAAVLLKNDFHTFDGNSTKNFFNKIVKLFNHNDISGNKMIENSEEMDKKRVAKFKVKMLKSNDFKNNQYEVKNTVNLNADSSTFDGKNYNKKSSIIIPVFRDDYTENTKVSALENSKSDQNLKKDTIEKITQQTQNEMREENFENKEFVGELKRNLNIIRDNFEKIKRSPLMCRCDHELEKKTMRKRLINTAVEFRNLVEKTYFLDTSEFPRQPAATDLTLQEHRKAVAASYQPLYPCKYKTSINALKTNYETLKNKRNVSASPYIKKETTQPKPEVIQLKPSVGFDANKYMFEKKLYNRLKENVRQPIFDDFISKKIDFKTVIKNNHLKKPSLQNKPSAAVIKQSSVGKKPSAADIKQSSLDKKPSSVDIKSLLLNKNEQSLLNEEDDEDKTSETSSLRRKHPAKKYLSFKKKKPHERHLKKELLSNANKTYQMTNENFEIVDVKFNPMTIKFTNSENFEDLKRNKEEDSTSKFRKEFLERHSSTSTIEKGTGLKFEEKSNPKQFQEQADEESVETVPKKTADERKSNEVPKFSLNGALLQGLGKLPYIMNTPKKFNDSLPSIDSLKKVAETKLKSVVHPDIGNLLKKSPRKGDEIDDVNKLVGAVNRAIDRNAINTKPDKIEIYTKEYEKDTEEEDDCYEKQLSNLSYELADEVGEEHYEEDSEEEQEEEGEAEVEAIYDNDINRYSKYSVKNCPFFPPSPSSDNYSLQPFKSSYNFNRVFDDEYKRPPTPLNPILYIPKLSTKPNDSAQSLNKKNSEEKSRKLNSDDEQKSSTSTRQSLLNTHKQIFENLKEQHFSSDRVEKTKSNENLNEHTEENRPATSPFTKNLKKVKTFRSLLHKVSNNEKLDIDCKQEIEKLKKIPRLVLPEITIDCEKSWYTEYQAMKNRKATPTRPLGKQF